MHSETTYKIDSKDFAATLESFVRKHEAKVFDRFYNVMVDAKTVAKIHGTTPQTVGRYIKSGILVPEPSTGRVYQFRLSEILKIDFSTLKYQRHGSRFKQGSVDGNIKQRP